ncbi:hypothetical protein GWK47_041886 [Chionoecetes opilio]|uniref:Uncharacterized protein n=1 Tax=Chionoecetes opilio TaxID=41210 RepID=A0A8J5CWL6_CHIOP|nr:hypothetical protein GWK47_041886 [Chionoecetes opilio]
MAATYTTVRSEGQQLNQSRDNRQLHTGAAGRYARARFRLWRIRGTIERCRPCHGGRRPEGEEEGLARFPDVKHRNPTNQAHELRTEVSQAAGKPPHVRQPWKPTHRSRRPGRQRVVGGGAAGDWTASLQQRPRSIRDRVEALMSPPLKVGGPRSRRSTPGTCFREGLGLRPHNGRAKSPGRLSLEDTTRCTSIGLRDQPCPVAPLTLKVGQPLLVTALVLTIIWEQRTEMWAHRR